MIFSGAMPVYFVNHSWNLRCVSTTALASADRLAVLARNRLHVVEKEEEEDDDEVEPLLEGFVAEFDGVAPSEGGCECKEGFESECWCCRWCEE